MKNKNLIDSFNNSINGILYAIKNERNMKIHVIAAFFILLLSLFYNLTRTEFLVIVLTSAFVLVCELFNTAVEVLVDIVVDIYHPRAKIVKDVAAGAVLVASFSAIVVAYMIFFDRIHITLEKGIFRLKNSPIHITVISLIITILIVLIIKAYFKRGTLLQGGFPSGHTAIAFSIATAIALWTGDINITIMGAILALLVAESRVETKVHTIFEVLVGGIIGFIVTVLLFQLFYIVIV